MKNGDIKVSNVYRTSNLSEFKMLFANRDISKNRAREIKDSIERNGWLHAPILVNEKMEVIDGQARLLACKELKRDIEYIVVTGFGISECQALNSAGRRWTSYNYIESFASLGVVDFIRFKNLISIYNKIKVAAFAARLYGAVGVDDQQAIRDGKIKITEEVYEQAANALRWVKELRPTIKAIGTSEIALEKALLFAYFDSECDNDRMKFQLQRNVARYPEVSTVDGALKALSYVYNFNCRDKKVYLDTDYSKLKDALKMLEV